MYTVFDFKPLESEVFVPALSSDNAQPQIKVFTSAKGEYQTKYCIKKGTTYRSDQKRSFVGYNSKVKFRQEGSGKPEDQEKAKEFIAQKSIEHLNISLSAFPFFVKPFEKNERIPFEIFKSFMQLVEMDYGIKYDNLEQTVKLEEFWPETQSTTITGSGSEFEEGMSR